METINYIIPLCNTGGNDYYYRLKNVNHILKEYLSKNGGVHTRAILIEQIIDPEAATFLDNINFPPENTYFTYKTITVKHNIFVKPWLYNIAVNEARGEHIIIGESDAYVEPGFFVQFLQFVRDRKWCFVWDKQYKLNKSNTEELIANGKLESYTGTIRRPTPGLCEGMGVYFKKSFWWDELHGANEMYQKLGGNDNELAYRASRLTGTYESYPVTVLHMWHPVSDMKFGKVQDLNQNMKLYLKQEERYKEVTDYLATLRLGDPEKPLEFTEEMKNRFSDTRKGGKGAMKILVSEPWTPRSACALKDWVAYLREVVDKEGFERVVVGVLAGQEENYAGLASDFIKFKDGEENPQISKLTLRNYAKLGYVSHYVPGAISNNETPTEQSPEIPEEQKSSLAESETNIEVNIPEIASKEETSVSSPKHIEEESQVPASEPAQEKYVEAIVETPKYEQKQEPKKVELDDLEPDEIEVIKQKIEALAVDAQNIRKHAHEIEKGMRSVPPMLDKIRQRMDIDYNIRSFKEFSSVMKKRLSDFDEKMQQADRRLALLDKLDVVENLHTSIVGSDTKFEKVKEEKPEEITNESKLDVGSVEKVENETAPKDGEKVELEQTNQISIVQEKVKKTPQGYHDVEDDVLGNASIVMACRNEDEYIRKALPNLLTHTLKEVVIVDCSSDKPILELVRELTCDDKKIWINDFTPSPFFKAGYPKILGECEVIHQVGVIEERWIKKFSIIRIEKMTEMHRAMALNGGSRACVGRNLYYMDPGEDTIDLHEAYIRTRGQMTVQCPDEPIPGMENVSIISTCMNRMEFLYQSLPTWVNKGFKEIIIIDWSSDKLVIEQLEEFSKYDNIKVVRVNDQDHFNAGKARNHGARVASGDYFLFIDSDMKIVNFDRVVLGEDRYYHGENKMPSFGCCFIPRKAFEAINGYTEFMPGYGWEDNDIYDRLEVAGFERIYLQKGAAYHIDHPDWMRILHRGQNGKDLAGSLQENTFQRDNWKVWSKDEIQEIKPYTITPLSEYWSERSLEPMKKNLLYYMYPVDSPMLHFNIRKLSEVQDVFDRKIIYAGLDENTISELEVKQLLELYGIKDAELRIRENDPQLGDGAFFVNMLAEVKSTDPNEVSFFAHAKGVSPNRKNKVWEESTWIERMYELNFTHMNRIESRLRLYPCVGAFKVGQHKHSVPAPWYYAGTFFWFNHKKVFERKDWFIPGEPNRYRAEAYLGVRFEDREAPRIMETEGSLLYYKDTYKEVVSKNYPRGVYLMLTVKDNAQLFRKQMEYYSSLGVDRFLISINQPQTSPVVKDMEYVLKNYKNFKVRLWTDPYTEEQKDKIERLMIDETCVPDDWVVFASPDEFQEYPVPIRKYLEKCLSDGKKCLKGTIIDRIADGGEIPIAYFDKSLEEQFPNRAYLSESIFNEKAVKIAAALASEKSTDDMSGAEIEIHSFKWNRSYMDSLKTKGPVYARAVSEIQNNGSIDLDDDSLQVMKESKTLKV